MKTFSNIIDLLLKGHGHRYIKRIPYMTPKGRRYRYIYKVTQSHKGKHAMDESHLVEGTKFMVHTESGKEVHGHIKSVDGDKVTYVLDDGADKGTEITATRSEIVAMMNEKHDVSEKVGAKQAEIKAKIEQARKTGTEKQVARLEAQLKRLGNETSSMTLEEVTNRLREIYNIYAPHISEIAETGYKAGRQFADNSEQDELYAKRKVAREEGDDVTVRKLTEKIKRIDSQRDDLTEKVKKETAERLIPNYTALMQEEKKLKRISNLLEKEEEDRKKAEKKEEKKKKQREAREEKKRIKAQQKELENKPVFYDNYRETPLSDFDTPELEQLLIEQRGRASTRRKEAEKVLANMKRYTFSTPSGLKQRYSLYRKEEKEAELNATRIENYLKKVNKKRKKS